MSKASEFVGKQIKANGLSMTIKDCRYCGMKTCKGGKVIKMVRVETECGAIVETEIESLEECVS